MSLVGFRARNHPQQQTQRDVDDRRTPGDFFHHLHAERRFTIDVAATADNAMLRRFWTAEDDALSQSWHHERVWCNPPYSRLAPRLIKAWGEMQWGQCESVTMLLPANRCEQRWWQEWIEPFRDGPITHGIRLTTRFLSGRMRFERGSSPIITAKGDVRPPFGCVLVTWERVP